MRFAFLLVLGWGALAPPSFAQLFPKPPHRGGEPAAQMDAMVLDAAGHVATDLTAADFSLESSKPVKIVSCKYIDTQASRTVVFIVDDLSLTEDAIEAVRAALGEYVQTAPPDDRFAILRSGSGEGDLQPLTSDKQVLSRAIAGVSYNPRRAHYATGAARTSAFNTGAMANLRQAIAGLSELPGRKSVVLFGMALNGLAVTGQESLVADARRSQVSIYGIDPSAPAAVPVQPPASTATAQPLSFTNLALTELADSGMASMAAGTGGALLAGAAAIPAALARATSGPDGYYQIAYQEPESWDGHIELKVKRPGMQPLVSFNIGQDRVDPMIAAARERADDLPRAMSEPFATAGIHTQISPLFYNDAGQSRVLVFVYLDGHDLTFRRALDGRYHGGVRVLAAAFGPGSLSLAHREESFQVAWDENQYREALQNGIVLGANLQVKAGMFQIRTVVTDDNSGKLGSASQWLEVPTVEDGRLAISGIDLSGPEDSASSQKPTNRPPSRPIFHRNQRLAYHCEVYNPTLEPQKGGKIELQVVLFRDGHMTVANQPVEFALDPGGDSHRFALGGHITLPGTLEPGHYVIRFGISDQLSAADKLRTASQFAEFDLQP